jgi:ribosome-binding factor A
VPSLDPGGHFDYKARVPTHQRSDRVAQEMIAELSSLLRRDVKDPRVGQLTITRLELSKDLRDGRVFWVPLGGIGDAARIASTEAGLAAAGAFLQGAVGRNLRLRVAPRLSFHYDRGVENLVTIHERLDALKRAPQEGEP